MWLAYPLNIRALSQQEGYATFVDGAFANMKPASHSVILSPFSPEEPLLMEETLEIRGGGWCCVGLKHGPILTLRSDARPWPSH